MEKKLSTHAHVAKLIRAELKARGIKGAVRSESFAGGNAVRIELHDLRPEVYESLSDFFNQFQYGSFDGMTDSYNYDNRRSDIPQVRWVQAQNRPSNEMREEVYQFFRTQYAGGEDLPATYLEACIANKVFHGQHISDKVFRYYSEKNSPFWGYKDAQK